MIDNTRWAEEIVDASCDAIDDFAGEILAGPLEASSPLSPANISRSERFANKGMVNVGVWI